MKYIIEIEDEPFGRNDDPNIPHGMDELYRAKGFNSLVFDQFGLDKLTPLDKALNSELGEAYHKGFKAGQNEATTIEYQKGFDDAKRISEEVCQLEYNKGLNDAWQVAKYLFCEMSNTEINLVFPHEWNNGGFKALMALDPKDAIDRINAFERKQESDEIKVGDEVESLETGCTYIIHEIDGKDVKGYNFKRRYTCCGEKNDFKKTGRHFPQVAELLKAMKGEQRNCSTCWHDDGNGVPQCTGCYASKGYNMWKPKEGAE